MTVLEIDLKALEHNYRYLRSKISPHSKFMAVVKAFAYGSEAVSIATKLEHLGVDFFAVAYLKEGIALRKGGVRKPILVLHPQSPNLDDLFAYKLTPNIYSHSILDAFIAKSKKQKNYPIHLKFNTGLNRLGFLESDIDKILSKINGKKIQVEGIFSHLAASEDLKERSFSLGQLEKFNRIAEKMITGLGYKPLLHFCNTSGILNYPQAHFDLVRSGIGLYGFGNSAEENKNLIPVAELKTIISQIHHIKKGESVGYNRGYIAEKPTKTATLPLGHADGINRIYGKGKGVVYIHGKPAPIIGNVCMDMIMVDISHIECAEGDEVVIFGKENSAEDFAHNAGTISYELITSISQRIERKILNENDPT